MPKWAAYVRTHNAEDFLKCGWMPSNALVGTGHGEYSLLMTKPECECGKILYPKQ